MAIINLSTPKRKSSDGFLRSYVNYTRTHEAPEDFHVWAGFAILSMAVGRNVFLDRGPVGKIFPNIYTILIAESALMRKSSTIRMAVNIAKEALGDSLHVFSQKITPESFVHYLAVLSEKEKRAVACIVSDELAITLSNCAKDPSLLQLLTTLYDCPGTWEYSTISRGIEKLQNVHISMLAGSTPEWLKSSMPEDAVGGGFFSRLLPVNRLEPSCRNAHPEDIDDVESLKFREMCIHDLRAIAQIEGQFKWSPKAKTMFADWYMDYNNPDAGPDALRGYFGRKGDSIIKIAMLTSISRDDSLIITDQDFYFALSLLTENEKSMADIVAKMGQTTSGKNLSHVLEVIRKKGVISHSALLRHFYYKFDKDELRLVVDTLRESDQIETVHPNGKGAVYCMKGMATKDNVELMKRMVS